MTMDSLIISYINTIRALLFWKIIVSHQAVTTRNISTSDIVLTDRIHKGDMSVEWFSTGEMTGYLLTEPNQGYIHTIFRHLIMVVMPETDPSNRIQGNRKKNQTIKSKQG